MSKHEVKNNTKNKKGIGSVFLKIAIVAIILVVIALVLHFAYNYLREEETDQTNLIINNSNVTASLKYDVYIENGVVYLSQADIANFFDSTIYYDEDYDQIITSSYDKLAAMPVGEKQIEVNSSYTTIKASVMQKDGIYYIPFSALENVYNVKVNYFEETNIFTVDSLDRDYSIATATKNSNVKYKPSVFSKTVAKVSQGESYIIANRDDYPVPDGWTRVRTEDGILGYVPTNRMGQVNTIREAMEVPAKVEGTVSLVWDYYSEYVTAPDRTNTSIDGVNVVSPSFFYLTRLGKGEVEDNIGEDGEQYIAWAKENGYEIWPIISNNSYIETTSEIMRDYKLREELINQIVNYITEYDLDGINIDFENMYAEDKDHFSRFIIELIPRLNEIGAVLSVDVTAPDGGETWSMCYDRNAIAEAADYIIFMAYDQYGSSSTKSGTTAGYNWVETNINKFLGQEGVDASKLILGIPFYTRLWIEQSGTIVSRDTVAMANVENVLPSGVEKTWDEDLKQYYVEYTRYGYTYKMWVEDEESIAEKLNLITGYNLAGAAFWVKDMESEGVWSLVASKLET